MISFHAMRRTGSALSQKVAKLEGHTDAVWDLAVHPFQSLVLSASADATIRLWNIEEGSSSSSSSPLSLLIGLDRFSLSM